MLLVSNNNGSSLSLSNINSQTKNSSTSNLSMTSNGDPFYGLSFKVGVAENKNTTYRSKMEDVHTYVANFAERLDWGYFAIFDGHAGKQTARWCGNNLHTLLEQEIIASEEKISNETMHDYDMKDNLYNTFVKADNLIQNEGNGNSGSTAAVVVLVWENKHQPSDGDNTSSKNKPVDIETPNSSNFDFRPNPNQKRMLYTANVGDLRIVLFRNNKAYRLSYDHKATDLNEMNRIRDSGGLVMKNRVNGVLAVTRSLGDTYMKELVVGKPFTTSTEISLYDEFMILACDGLWDVISDTKACDIVKKSLQDNDDPQEAAKKLCQIAMDNSTTDNITVMVVKFDDSIFEKDND